MSRASVANAAARAEAWWNYARRVAEPFEGLLPSPSRHTRGGPRRPPPLSSSALLVRVAIPVGVAIAVLVLVAALYRSSLRERDRVIGDATADLDFLAAIVADDIDAHIRETPDAASAASIQRLIAALGPNHGQHVLVSDAGGTIVAAVPPLAFGHTVAEQIGATQPLTIFAEKAGVMHLVLPNGHEALATVRSLRAPYGQVVVTHRIDDVLCDWRANLAWLSALLGCLAVVIATAVLACLRQASKTRDANASCAAMRERVGMVLSRGRCGLWDWNLASGQIEWSDSMFEIIGMTPRVGPLKFSEVNSLIHPGDGGLNALTVQLQSGEARTVDHVFRMQTRSGGWIWLQAKAEIVAGDGGSPHVVGIAMDITETMALEERTAKADIRLRDAIETVSEAFVVWDAENRLVMCNSKFQRFHNLPPDAIKIGTPYADVMEQGTPPLIHSQVTLGGQQPLGARTFEAQLGDGRWLQINERRTKDGGYVSVGTDITALKRNEEQLIESERRLMNTIIDLKKSRQKLETQTQQLAELAEKYLEQKAEAETASRAKSDFLANMGHELRTPLNAILGFSEVMMMESFGKIGSSHYLDYSKDIHASGQQLLAMIADVLEMSRLEAGRVRLRKAKFSVGDAIDAAAASVAAAAEHGHVALLVEGSRDLEIEADRDAVEKILTIFLNNAVKYTPANGRIVLRSATVAGSLNLHVEDTGVGIPPNALSKLGRPFEQFDQTLKNGMRGSGLGLAIARSLVELHGGAMRIASHEGVGTTVLIQLPNCTASPRQLPPHGPALARSTTQSTRSVVTAIRPAVPLSRTA